MRGFTKRLQQRHARRVRNAADVSSSGAVPLAVRRALGGSSRPLDAATRTVMQQRLGHDFSRVRVHTGDRASQSARAVNALAYTFGRNVVFGAGRYAPTTGAGRGLLAHELAHVTQQARGRPIPISCAALQRPRGDPYEREADRVANQLTPMDRGVRPVRWSGMASRGQVPSMQKKARPATVSGPYMSWFPRVMEQYWALKNELTGAGYEIVTFVVTEAGVEQRIPQPDTPVESVRWRITPPGRKPFWADAAHVIQKMSGIVRRRRAAETRRRGAREGAEEDITFFSSPRRAGLRVPGQWELMTDTDDGVRFFENLYRTAGGAGEEGVVKVPCGLEKSGEGGAYSFREAWVPLPSGERIGDMTFIGRYQGRVLMKRVFMGRTAIVAYDVEFFFDHLQDLASKYGRFRSRLNAYPACQEKLRGGAE